MEGFAEFMSLVLADQLKQSSPDVYAGFGSLETDYLAWINRGYDEEFAVAGVLWDLYDPKNDDDVDLTLDQVFNTLRPYRKDFTEVHKAFIKKFPGLKDEINEIFKKHGFFIDKTKGSGNWSIEEPFRDANGNKRYELGEYYIDYAQENLMAYPHMIWQSGEKIGSAANYNRLTRTNAGKTPGHFVKVDNNYQLYNVKVEFSQHSEWDYETITDNENGLIYVHIPGQIYETKITVTPEGVEGTPLVFTSGGFYKNIERTLEQGYYIFHDFGLSDVENDESDEDFEVDDFNAVPYWEDLDLEISDADFEYEAVEETDDGFSFFKIFLFIILIVGLIIIFRNFLKKKKKHSKKNKKNKK